MSISVQPNSITQKNYPIKKTFPAKPLVNSTNFMASTPHKLASHAAHSIFTQGGNCVDAAIAAQLVLGVVTPEATGLGGGGFISVYDKSQQKTVIYDARETAPANIANNEYDDHYGNTPSYLQSVAGGRSVGVPGLLQGLKQAHDEHGNLAWGKLFEPAINIAKNGFEMPDRLHNLLKKMTHYIRLSESAKRYLRSDGTIKSTGEIIKNPELADTLKTLAKEGTKPFYEGKIAQDILDTATQTQVYPSKMTLDDLKNYKVIKRDPITATYKDYSIHVPPSPSSGGIAVLQALKIIEKFNPESYDANDPKLGIILNNAIRLAYQDRNRYVADPAFSQFDDRQLLRDDYIAEKTKLVPTERSLDHNDMIHSTNLESIKPSRENLNANTSHSSFIDDKGNGVSLTSSVEFGFGSGLETKSGIILNSTLSDFNIDGHKTGSVNKIEPNKRPRSAMCPLFVINNSDKEIKLIAGSPGGPAIIGFLVHRLVDILNHGIKSNIALSRPNYLAMKNDNTLEIEEKLTSPEEINTLKNNNFKPIPTKLWLSGLQVIEKDSGFISGASDPRRDGVSVGG